MSKLVILTFLVLMASTFGWAQDKRQVNQYPAVWFTPNNDPNKPDWEILPQEAKAGEVILSKRQ